MAAMKRMRRVTGYSGLRREGSSNGGDVVWSVRLDIYTTQGTRVHGHHFKIQGLGTRGDRLDKRRVETNARGCSYQF